MPSINGLVVLEAAVRHESFDFGSLGAEEPAVAEREIDAVPSFKVPFTKMRREVDVRADRFVLAAAREAGVRLPFSCSTGLCGTCKSKLVSGRVDMAHKGGIRQREIDAGLFLPCCFKPLSDLVVER